MGLDQYAYVADTFEAGQESSDDFRGEELAYWRKHPNLQGYMKRLWLRRILETEGEFNCVRLPLTLEDIDQLESAVTNDLLPESRGFFWGENADAEYKEQDLRFCSEAREHLKAGRFVVYESWD